MRLFLAVSLAPELRQAAGGMQARLRRGISAVKWVRPEQLHLTLYFLGEIGPQQTAALKTVMRELEAEPSFPLALAGAGAFPSERKPQLLWAGVRDSSGGLAALHARVGALLRAAGLRTEDAVAYRAHITLGRMRCNARAEGAAAALKQEAAVVSEPGHATAVELMESRLSSAGPVYRVVERTGLRGKR